MDLEKIAEEIQQALKKGDFRRVADLQDQVRKFENRFTFETKFDDWNEVTKTANMELEISKNGFVILLDKDEQMELLRELQKNESCNFILPF